MLCCRSPVRSSCVVARRKSPRNDAAARCLFLLCSSAAAVTVVYLQIPLTPDSIRSSTSGQFCKIKSSYSAVRGYRGSEGRKRKCEVHKHTYCAPMNAFARACTHVQAGTVLPRMRSPVGLCLLVREADVCDAVVNACENACEMLSGVRVVGIMCLSGNIRSGVT